MIMSPCKDCADRHAACHDQCERYKEYRTELAAQRGYTQQMTRNHTVYHVDYRDKERDARRKRCFYGQK